MSTATLERPMVETNQTQLTANYVHEELEWRVNEITAADQERLGIVQTSLQEVAVQGLHRLFVLNEMQPGNNFKYNGASVAVWQTLREDPSVTTFVTGTSGNWGSSLAAAGQGVGKQVICYTPWDVPQPKRKLMTASGGEVRADCADVSQATKAAQDYAHSHPNSVFMHAYDNLWGMAGQKLVGKRLVAGIRQLRESSERPGRINLQRGGGSLEAGVASAVFASRLGGLTLADVRPEQVAGGLDPWFEGLAVAEPGRYAQAILGDKRFVQAQEVVSRVQVSRAARLMATALGRQFEPSGLAGVAACLADMDSNLEPTDYFAVLSGANVTDERFRELANAEQGAALQVVARQAARGRRRWSTRGGTESFGPRGTSNNVLNGPTRRCLVMPEISATA